MMIYAGDQSRQLAVAYVTASGKLEKLEVAFQKTSIWMETGQCVWERKQGEGRHDVSIFKSDAKYWFELKKKPIF